jgi:CDP-paratose 2-epimerase
MKILVTGSGGLIGSSVAEFYLGRGEEVIGVDNNMRETFFGPDGDTSWMTHQLGTKFKNYSAVSCDIRDYTAVSEVIRSSKPDLIVHCAAQPSHDLAAKIPILDFEVNAVGTLNLLESTRNFSPESVFLHMSTNKVYGDRPNQLAMTESEQRFDFSDAQYQDGIDESFSIDQSLHSVFGASKVSADVMAQEYGRYFGLSVGVFRGGCLTGPSHSGVQLHGFLSYLVKCVVHEKPYTIIGYGGKQVRDQIHGNDVAAAIDEFAMNPRSGMVFNIGGGRANSLSVIESIDVVERIAGKKLSVSYDTNARVGDHICYYSNMSRFKSEFPNWKPKYGIDEIVEEIVRTEFDKTNT